LPIHFIYYEVTPTAGKALSIGWMNHWGWLLQEEKHSEIF